MLKLSQGAEPSNVADYGWYSSFETPSSIVAQSESAILSGSWWTSVPTKATTSQPLSLSSPQSAAIPDSKTASLSSTQSDLVPTTTESPLTLFSTETSYLTIPLIKTIQPSPPFSNVTQTTPETSATATSCGSDTGHFTINVSSFVPVISVFSFDQRLV